MESRSQSSGQALIELLFLLIFAFSYCLLAKKMTEKWWKKTDKVRFTHSGGQQ